jgi:hypothetical protein
LLNGGEADDLDHISNYCPFAENDKSFDFSQSQSQSNENGKLKEQYLIRHKELGRTIFNTHLLLKQHLPKAKDVRIVYVVRNCVDVAWSFYNHMINQVKLVVMVVIVF